MMKSTLFLAGLLLSATQLVAQNNFTLTSKSVGGQATVTQEFNGFGCTGKNESPELLWKNAPEGTKSFAVTMYDPDAPTGSGFWHWVVFDIPANVNELAAGAGDLSRKLIPAGAIQGRTDYGVPGYGGPCPPVGHGSHEYLITVYALKTDKLGLDANASAAVVGFYLNAQVLAKASIVMYYQR